MNPVPANPTPTNPPRPKGIRAGAFTYPETGATRLGPLPRGYHHLHHHALIGRGRAVFDAAGAAVTTWRMHRRAGTRVRAASPWAAPGVAVEIAVGWGPLRLTAPCEVVWAAYERHRTGFGYGTLAGHPERGEESFVVDFRDDGSVWFTVMAFSKPDRWYSWLAGPLVPVLQRWYARRLGHALKQISAPRTMRAGWLRRPGQPSR